MARKSEIGLIGFAVLAVSALLTPRFVMAQQSDAPDQSLDQAANDPTASLMALQFQNIYVGDYHNPDDESANTLLFRPVVRFEMGGLKNIARATIPYVTDSPSGKDGPGDNVLFDLVVFDRPWAAGARVR